VTGHVIYPEDAWSMDLCNIGTLLWHSMEPQPRRPWNITAIKASKLAKDFRSALFLLYYQRNDVCQNCFLETLNGNAQYATKSGDETCRYVEL